mmetsp:Transcript_102192/g.248367  ORF Transcript_102192/g.248367 Transcript_102192/m.248367 type:complete len:465 (-) Transcript_102192:492-1886(-)
MTFCPCPAPPGPPVTLATTSMRRRVRLRRTAAMRAQSQGATLRTHLGFVPLPAASEHERRLSELEIDVLRLHEQMKLCSADQGNLKGVPGMHQVHSLESGLAELRCLFADHVRDASMTARAHCPKEQFACLQRSHLELKDAFLTFQRDVNINFSTKLETLLRHAPPDAGDLGASCAAGFVEAGFIEEPIDIGRDQAANLKIDELSAAVSLHTAEIEALTEAAGHRAAEALDGLARLRTDVQSLQQEGERTREAALMMAVWIRDHDAVYDEVLDFVRGVRSVRCPTPSVPDLTLDIDTTPLAHAGAGRMDGSGSNPATAAADSGLAALIESTGELSATAVQQRRVPVPDTTYSLQIDWRMTGALEDLRADLDLLPACSHVSQRQLGLCDVISASIPVADARCEAGHVLTGTKMTPHQIELHSESIFVSCRRCRKVLNSPVSRGQLSFACGCGRLCESCCASLPVP